MARGAILVISGPSGVGKSTLVKRLLQDPELVWSVSATTRKPRTGEVDGRDYQFLSRDEFERRIRTDDFAEYAESFGNLYGTPLEPLRKALADGRVIVLDIDVQGARQIRRKFPGALRVFVTAPGDEELRRRLTRRASEDESALQERLERVRQETAAQNEYDYVVVNDDLDETVQRLREITAGLKQSGSEV